MFKNKKSYDYFESFHTFSTYALEAAKYLDEVINDYDIDGLSEQMDKMHVIENNCDIHHHAVNAELLSEFLPVISAEDILLLNDKLDNVVDTIEDILIGIYTFNVLNIRSQAIMFSNIIVQLAEALYDATEDFKHFKTSKTIIDKLKVVKRLEQEADEIYLTEMHRLHVEEENVKKLVMWTRVYDMFEDCADSFEEVTKEMEMIILKYT